MTCLDADKPLCTFDVVTRCGQARCRVEYIISLELIRRGGFDFQPKRNTQPMLTRIESSE